MVANRRQSRGLTGKSALLCSSRKFLMENDFRLPKRMLRQRMIYNQIIRGEQSARKKMEASMDAPKTGEFAHIGKSVVIKGELSGSEDLYVDGNVEGSIELRNHSLTVGPNGNVKADVSAKSVVVQGKLDGSVNASDRVELR